MAIFRDVEGNLYEIPAEELKKFEVQRELPVGTELSGEELRQVVGGASGRLDGPGYYS